MRGAGWSVVLGWLVADMALSRPVLAVEAPERPKLTVEEQERLENLPGVCVEEVAIRPGQAAPCWGVLVPPVVLAEEELLLRHLGVVEQLYSLEGLRAELVEEGLQGRLEWMQAEVAGRPVVERPVVAFVVGGVLGAGLAVGVSWAMPR